MTDREKVLLEILAEVTRPKTDHDTTRMEHPRRPGSQLGNLLYPDFQALALELEKDRDHWKAQAEATAKSLAQAHEELKEAKAYGEHWKGVAESHWAQILRDSPLTPTGKLLLEKTQVELADAQASARAWQEKALSVAAEEREACARLVETTDWYPPPEGTSIRGAIAAAIRRRGPS